MASNASSSSRPFRCGVHGCKGDRKGFLTVKSLRAHEKAAHWIRIEKGAIDLLPLATYDRKVKVIRDAASAKKAVAALLREKVVGFDTETRPNFVRGEARNRTAVVQCASAECAYLFQLTHLRDLSPLLPLLSSAGMDTESRQSFIQ